MWARGRAATSQPTAAPTIADVAAVLSVVVVVAAIPADSVDGITGAYWRCQDSGELARLRPLSCGWSSSLSWCD